MPIELIYRKVNAQFEKYFLCKEEVIGKKASEVFPESMPEFLHFIKKALDENKAITFPYYFKKSNTFYDVILKGTQHSNIIDVFCLDSTELHKAQQKDGYKRQDRRCCMCFYPNARILRHSGNHYAFILWTGIGQCI